MHKSDQNFKIKKIRNKSRVRSLYLMEKTI